MTKSLKDVEKAIDQHLKKFFQAMEAVRIYFILVQVGG